jgi:hypothetical protein
MKLLILLLLMSCYQQNPAIKKVVVEKIGYYAKECIGTVCACYTCHGLNCQASMSCEFFNELKRN